MTVERWAGSGSWVIGIGGNGTGRPDEIIYAMQVEVNLSLATFRHQSPRLAAYLEDYRSYARVLVSRRFYYLGDQAVCIPRELREHLLIRRQGCWRVSDQAVCRLEAYLAEQFGPAPALIGCPNNG
jgi:hypothetical protein